MVMKMITRLVICMIIVILKQTCKLIVTDLGKRQAVDADPEANEKLILLEI